MLEVRIFYCVPCGYLGLACSIATEFFNEGGEQVAVLLVPGLHGILEAQIDGETVYDKLAEDRFPTPPRIAEARERLREKLALLNARASQVSHSASQPVAALDPESAA